MSWSPTWDIRASPGSRPQGRSVGPRRRSAVAVAGTRRRRPARRRVERAATAPREPSRCGHRRWRCGSGGCTRAQRLQQAGVEWSAGAGRSAPRASSAVLRVVRASMPCCRSRRLSVPRAMCWTGRLLPGNSHDVRGRLRPSADGDCRPRQRKSVATERGLLAACRPPTGGPSCASGSRSSTPWPMWAAGRDGVLATSATARTCSTYAGWRWSTTSTSSPVNPNQPNKPPEPETRPAL
jgi:hypothetical protein